MWKFLYTVVRYIFTVEKVNTRTFLWSYIKLLCYVRIDRLVRDIIKIMFTCIRTCVWPKFHAHFYQISQQKCTRSAGVSILWSHIQLRETVALLTGQWHDKRWEARVRAAVSYSEDSSMKAIFALVEGCGVHRAVCRNSHGTEGHTKQFSTPEQH